MEDFDQLFLADFKELSLNECGRERCQPDKVIQMDIKPYHLFHYILSGKGTFVFNNITYHLRKGDIFYIPPHMTAKYFPNHDDPWIYVWIGFSGERSDAYLNKIGLSVSSPIYHDQKDLELKPMFNELAERYRAAKYLNIEVLSVFMNILYKMMMSKHRSEVALTAKQMHIKMAKQYIENNFQFAIKVTDIANALSLSPNYLANIFKEILQTSPKKYLIYYRILKATQLLVEDNLSIKEIAKRVGYDNPLHFSAEFKRLKNVSPKSYRNQNHF